MEAKVLGRACWLLYFFVALLSRTRAVDLLGCRMFDSICDNGEVCLDDGISGRCTAPDQADQLLAFLGGKYRLTEDGQLLLAYVVQTSSGDAPFGPRFQCEVAYFSLVARRGAPYKAGVCNIDRPELMLALIKLIESKSEQSPADYELTDFVDTDVDRRGQRSVVDDDDDGGDQSDVPLARYHHSRQINGRDPSDTNYDDPGRERSVADDDYDTLLNNLVKRAAAGRSLDFSPMNDGQLDNFAQYVAQLSTRVNDDDGGVVRDTRSNFEPPVAGISYGEIIDENGGERVGDAVANEEDAEEKFMFKKDEERLGIMDQGTGNKEHKIQTRFPNQPTPGPVALQFSINDETLRVVHGNRVYIRLNKSFTENDGPYLQKVADYLDEAIAKPNNLTFENYRVHVNEFSFDVYPKQNAKNDFLPLRDRIKAAFNLNIPAVGESASVDAGMVADQAYRLMKKAQSSLPQSASVVETGIGSGKNSLSVRRSSTTDDDDNFALLTLVVCSVVIGTLTIVLGTYFYKHRLRRWSLAGGRGGKFVPGYDFEGKPSKDYQELCRQHMNGRAPDDRAAENFATLSGGPGIVGTLAQRLGSQSEASPPPVPSTHSSTSSWSEEPVQTNMDITTGHTILSYMEKHLLDKTMLEHEWTSLEKYEPDLTTCSVAERNTTKNRYSDVLPYDHCRVILLESASQAGCDYINASFICDHDPRNPTYIATQGPLASTVPDFWQTVWEQGCVVIVNLTKLSENGDVKCARYWPENGSEVYHCYEIHLVSEHIWCTDYLVRSFYLKNLRTQETRTVTQFHFLTWPESGLPASTKSLLDFRRKVNKSFRGRSCPIILHCSDGSGRTGTYCLLDLVLNRINKGVKEVDIAATLEHLRDQRMKFVRTIDQFEFVLTCVAEEVQAVLKALPQ